MSQAPVTDEGKQAFLDALAKTGIIGSACRAAGVSRSAVYVWRQNDEQFADAYTEALADAHDTIEAEAHRRAVEGVTRQRALGSGENMQIIEELVYSDSLILALLKAKKPDEFAERTKAELTSPDGSLKPEHPTEAAARIASLFDEARRRREASDPLFE